jgi:hypothetical protein
MTGDGQSLCEKIGDVDGTRDEDNAELVLLHAIPQPVKSHIERFRHLQVDAVGGESYKIHEAIALVLKNIIYAQ